MVEGCGGVGGVGGEVLHEQVCWSHCGSSGGKDV